MEVENKYILKIYEEKSFSKAAQKLFITQPALSMAVKKIENNLGVPIFNRSKYPIELTEAGLIYVKGLEEILEVEKNTLSKINDIKNLEVGKVVIGATNYMINFVLAPVIKIFMEKHPNIDVKLIENSSPKSLKLLENNKIDLTFSCGDLDRNTYDLKETFDDEVLLSVPKKFIPRNLLEITLTKEESERKDFNKKRIKLSQLEDLKYILLNPDNNLHERALSMLGDDNFENKVIMYVDQLLTAHSLSINEIGGTFIGSYILPDQFNDNLGYFSLDYETSRRKFYSVRKKQSYESFAIKEFICVMQDFYS